MSFIDVDALISTGTAASANRISLCEPEAVPVINVIFFALNCSQVSNRIGYAKTAVTLRVLNMDE